MNYYDEMVKCAYEEICDEIEKEAYHMEGDHIVLDKGDYKEIVALKDKVKRFVRSGKAGKLLAPAAVIAGAGLGAKALGTRVKRANDFNKKNPELWERVQNGDPDAGAEYNKKWAQFKTNGYR